MKTLVVSERLGHGRDDGIKNIALAFLRELRRRGDEVMGLSEWESLDELGVEHFQANRFYLSTSLAARVQRFAPQRIIYVPWTSATCRGLFRLAALKMYAGGASTAIVATQPMSLGRLGRRLARWLRPDLAFIQCDKTRRILESIGCETAFFSSGHDPSRFSPASTTERRELRKELGLDPDAPLVVHVGHLKRQRIDPRLMAALLDSRPGLQMLLVGSPHTPQDESLVLELRNLGIHVLRDYIPDISRVYRAADVYLFPVTERFACVGVPLSVIEAMACGIPILSSPFGGLPALFSGLPGVHFADGLEALCRGLQTALHADGRGNPAAVAGMTWQRVIGEALDLLQSGTELPLRRARYLLSLLQGDAAHCESGPGSAGMSPAHTREQLRRNKIPLMALSDEGIARARLQQYQREAIGLLQHAQDEYRACRKTLESHGIETIFTKSAGPFPYESDNMDLLVDPQHTQEAMRVLEALDYIQMRHYREDFKTIQKRFDGPHQRNILHFHEEVSWGVEPFLNREDLWRRRRISPDDDEIQVLSREDAFLTITAHALYENDRIKLGDLWKMRRLLAPADFDWDYCRRTARSLGWELGYDLILVLFSHYEELLWGNSRIPNARREEAGNRMDRSSWRHFLLRMKRLTPRFPLPLSLPVTKLLFFRKILVNPQSNAGLKARRFLGGLRDNLEALAKVNNQHAFLVTLSGIDGSGKSTVLKALEQAFTLAEVRYRTAWVRGGNSVLLQRANRAFRALMGKRLDRVLASDSGSNPHREKVIVSPLLNALWPWVVSLEQGFLYLLRVRMPLLLGRVVLMDRSLFDTLVDLSVRCGDRNIARRIPLRLLAWLAPRPGCAWHLQVDPEAAHARKADDFPVAELTHRAARYDEMAETWGLTAVRTDGDPDETLRKVVNVTLKRYFARAPQ